MVALGRELLGGNGILSEFLVAKAFADMEAYYRWASEVQNWQGRGICSVLGWGVLETLGRHVLMATALCSLLLSSLLAAEPSVYNQCLRSPHPPTYTHSPQPAATRARTRSTRWWRAAASRVSRHSLGRRMQCICRGQQSSAVTSDHRVLPPQSLPFP